MTTIYAIWFPEAEDHSVYIGLTNNFEKRCREHIYESRRNTKRIVYKWMRKRMDDGSEPRFDILEVVDECCADDAEVSWQQWFSFCGWKPKHQKGGAHQIGYVFSDEHRANMSVAAKNRKGRAHSEETKAKLSAAWDEDRRAEHAKRVGSPEHRKKVSAGLKRAYVEGRKKPIEPASTCRKGHERTPENAYVTPQGFYQCRVCRRERERR